MSDTAVLRVQRLRPGARLPERATPSSTGYDLYACLDEGLIVGQEPALVPTGIAIEAQPGYDVQVRPRSGLSSKGVQVTFGTIDSDYRGEEVVTMYVLPYPEPHTIRPGDRIPQMDVTRTAEIVIEEAEALSASQRGAGGHGSTGS